jgi:hypothetical protein
MPYFFQTPEIGGFRGVLPVMLLVAGMCVGQTRAERRMLPPCAPELWRVGDQTGVGVVAADLPDPKLTNHVD